MPRGIETGEQLERGRLAGAGASHQGHVLAACDLERDAVQDRPVFAVPELDVTEQDRGRSHPILAIHGERHGRVQRESQRAEDPLGGRDAALDGLPFLAQCRDGLEEALQEKEERGKGTHRDVEGRQDVPRAGPQQSGHRERRQDGRRRNVNGREERRAIRREQPSTQDLTKAGHEVRHASEGANHFDAA